MKIAVTSDTFGSLPKITDEFDIFVHCGNFCPKPLFDKMAIFNQKDWLSTIFIPWLKNIKAKEKIIIPGQFDIAVSSIEAYFEYYIDAIFLKDSHVTINGLIFHAMPWVPNRYKKYLTENCCYVAQDAKTYEIAVSRIPDETNILITRIPPYGILDISSIDKRLRGDKILGNRISTLKNLQLHAFGFIQNKSSHYFEKNSVVYVNGCLEKTGYIEINT